MPSNLNTEPWHQLSHFHRKSTERQHVISMNNTPEEEKKTRETDMKTKTPQRSGDFRIEKEGKRRIYAKNTKLAPALTHTHKHTKYIIYCNNSAYGLTIIC